MNKVAQRLLVFFIGVPFIIGIVTLSYYNHIALNMLAIFCSAFAAHEFYNMAKLKFKMFPKTAVIIFTAALPFLAYNSILVDMDFSNLSWFLVLEIFTFMGAESLISKDFTESVTKIAITVLILFYCGYMITFIIHLTAIKENASIFLYLYFILVFMTDSGAWFFGVLFGKSTRGFFGGIITAIACGILFKLIFPTVFFGSIWKIVLVSFGTSLAAIIGDLIESVFKRSLGVKDSGTLIPGRGGLLDCLDSLILGAPVYYIGIHFLYLFAQS